LSPLASWCQRLFKFPRRTSLRGKMGPSFSFSPFFVQMGFSCFWARVPAAGAGSLYLSLDKNSGKVQACVFWQFVAPQCLREKWICPSLFLQVRGPIFCWSRPPVRRREPSPLVTAHSKTFKSRWLPRPLSLLRRRYLSFLAVTTGHLLFPRWI